MLFLAAGVQLYTADDVMYHYAVLQVQEQAMPNYNFTVHSFLKAAGRKKTRMPCGRLHTDHVIEMQLVVAALNTLPDDTYVLARLVDFFNERICSV